MLFSINQYSSGRMQAKRQRPIICNALFTPPWLKSASSNLTEYKMPSSLSYGVELEFLFPQHYSRADVEKTMRKTKWRVKTDDSIVGAGLALEINSPVLTGTSGFQSIVKACRAAGALCPQLNWSTACHIHVGRDGSYWQLRQLQNLCANFIEMEESFDALCPAYRKDSPYARSNKKLLLDNNLAIQSLLATTSTEQLINLFNPGGTQGCRYFKLNLRSLGRHNTVAGITALCVWFAILAGERIGALPKQERGPPAREGRNLRSRGRNKAALELNHVFSSRGVLALSPAAFHNTAPYSPVQQVQQLLTFLEPAGQDLADFVSTRAASQSI
ncbi:hypothetical protein DUNSADRAFT_5978 [Dunaliella salina]|uniref:Amidoligase enzyme n=2 Tax=Dunaliella salina TaxID=3046 RepID=A0ABQ7GP67_DUNSA|nr:hypothetical protein DUNSADRAFT_5978 [Dunaliella salina]|eukprot:KAF5836405.1 hypothetical protein DUNSADRAFT_5978 [Dunaliella salina]